MGTDTRSGKPVAAQWRTKVQVDRKNDGVDLHYRYFEDFKSACECAVKYQERKSKHTGRIIVSQWDTKTKDYTTIYATYSLGAKK